jgi:type IV pilus assembly protein PilW
MTKTQNRGFTLVELLISITISLVAIAAASSAYLTSKQTNRIQAIQSRVLEDGRFAVAMLQRTVQQAGFRQSPLAALPADRISIATNVVTLKFASDGTNQINCDGSTPAAGSAQTLVIQKSGDKLQCATNGGAAVDWIAPATSGSGMGSEVMYFAVLLGVDTGPTTNSNYGCGADTGTKPRDCIADKYVSALSGAEAASQIVSARFCVVLRSQAIDGAISKPAAVKNCSGADIANSQSDLHLYRVYWTTVLLKNR